MAGSCLVGMSGGVDSSVAALILKEKGMDVCGATLHLFSNEDTGIPSDATCCSLSDIEDARRVCYRLGVEHMVFNFEETFKREVMNRFACAYLKGLTPNPCIDCNHFVKFPALDRRASELGYDHIATGHYANVSQDAESGRFVLRKGLDSSKDQSYVLFGLPQAILSKLVLPLGSISKKDVRDLAASAGLNVAEKPDSQDICFIPDGDYVNYLLDVMDVKPSTGLIRTLSGVVVGQHDGLWRFTIGQRKGIGVYGPEPYYVLRKDIEHNELIVGTHDDLKTGGCIVDDVNWVSIACPEKDMDVYVKTRYRQKPISARIIMGYGEGSSAQKEQSVKVVFAEDAGGVAPGQACVFYSDDIVLGGGAIESTFT